MPSLLESPTNKKICGKAADIISLRRDWGRLETHLADGGMSWLWTTSPEVNTSWVAKQGPRNHGRATKDGCELSTKSTGEGAEELTRTENLLRRGFMARGTVEIGARPNFR